MPRQPSELPLPRPYHTPVRDQRRAATRETILRAMAEIVAHDGVAELAVQQVADRAGVTHRTVYRHFPDRQALLDALGAWVRERLSHELDEHAVGNASQLLDRVPWVFTSFDALGAPAVAMARLAVATGSATPQHRDRSALFDELLAPHLESFDDPEAVFAVLRHLLSALTWWVLGDEFGLDGERAGQAVATVMRAVLAEAERAEGT